MRPIAAVAFSFALLVTVVAAPIFSDEVDHVIVDGGMVATHVDELTDEYLFTSLAIGAYGGQGHFVLWDLKAGFFTANYYGQSSARHVVEAPIDVHVRIDRRAATTISALWTEYGAAANFLISDSILDDLIGADMMIYRIGDGPILRIKVPGEIADLVAEFRHRVMHQGEAHPTIMPAPEVKPAMTFEEAAENRRRLTGN